ncbi:hypothetical protein J0H33_08880, partial [bacterium]|nr:hypothetical protein [bacterium]
MGPRRISPIAWLTATAGREAMTWAGVGIAGIAMAAGGLVLYGQGGSSGPVGQVVHPGSPTPTQIAPVGAHATATQRARPPALSATPTPIEARPSAPPARPQTSTPAPTQPPPPSNPPPGGRGAPTDTPEP